MNIKLQDAVTNIMNLAEVIKRTTPKPTTRKPTTRKPTTPKPTTQKPQPKQKQDDGKDGGQNQGGKKEKQAKQQSSNDQGSKKLRKQTNYDYQPIPERFHIKADPGTVVNIYIWKFIIYINIFFISSIFYYTYILSIYIKQFIPIY